MMGADQQIRLEIHSRFLYAANSIVFDYLQYLEGDDGLEISCEDR